MRYFDITYKITERHTVRVKALDRYQAAIEFQENGGDYMQPHPSNEAAEKTIEESREVCPCHGADIGDMGKCAVTGEIVVPNVGRGGGYILAVEEAREHVAAGADNVMCQSEYCCDDDECECTPDNPCWYGLQQGDDIQEGRNYELW